MAEGETPETYCLSSFFEPIVQKLLETTDRNDGAQHNLRSAAYEALMELIKNSPKVYIGSVRFTLFLSPSI